MVKSSLRENYLLILYIILQLQYADPQKSYVPKYLISQKLSTFPDTTRKFLKLNWKPEGFNRAIYRLQDLQMIESQVIIAKKRKQLILRLTHLGEKMIQEHYSVLRLIFSSASEFDTNPFPASPEFFAVRSKQTKTGIPK
uniref:ArnR1-like winged helix-turn-helix domain-containing protein n=1 Tax=Promethearchaeum syntrophicum TaxID=2594042 RepID=A0A5B9DFF6_9ARCH|nr:hypothetical protein [Candidatus Prometheoarchaeum syntrophicum]QEE17751.1 hypothetical protein DSAG12_03589 [Candidatus Prometheoarchaeum syntrophicum]